MTVYAKVERAKCPKKECIEQEKADEGRWRELRIKGV